MSRLPQVPVLILDFDGTIRKSKGGHTFIQGPGDIMLLHGIKDKILEYHERNFGIWGWTNQGGVELGYKSATRARRESTSTMNRVDFLLNKKQVFSGCITSMTYKDQGIRSLRKPGVGGYGVIEQFYTQKNMGVDWDNSLFVGDRPEDQECAMNGGIAFMWAKDFFAF